MIQSSRFPHPDDQTNSARVAAMKAQFTLLTETLTKKNRERAKEVLITLMPWIMEGDWEFPIQAMNNELDAIEHRADMEDVAAMRRGE